MKQGAGETILVLDDDDEVRASISEALSTLGYDIVSAADGVTALRLMEEKRPRLAILDYAMPGMTGAEVARAAQAIRPDMKVVFASGYAETRVLEEIVGAGAVILRKPFTMADLASLVARELAT